MTNYDEGIGGLRGLVIGLALGFGIRGCMAPDEERVIPDIAQVQAGYIAPNKIKIECKDLDRNGQPETLLKIGGMQYLLREVKGIPVVSTYTLKGAEIVPEK